MKYAACLTTLLIIPGIATGHSGYIGFSGAPESNGTCTNSCHGQYDFVPSVTVTGFPESYEPGLQYEISVGHTSERPINQFNASVRIGTGSDNAGALSEGTNTATYNTSNETNGVRWSTADTDSGSFFWTAPEAGTGDVRLYWAGLQGTRADGADTQVVLLAHEHNTDVEYFPGTPSEFYLEQNYPNPFNDRTVVEISLAKAGQVHFIITNILGQLVFEWRQDMILPGVVAIRWDGTGLNGNELPSGIYFYRLTSRAGTLTKKMMLLR